MLKSVHVKGLQYRCGASGSCVQGMTDSVVQVASSGAMAGGQDFDKSSEQYGGFEGDRAGHAWRMEEVRRAGASG